jgi:hypothetical protein
VTQEYVSLAMEGHIAEMFQTTKKGALAHPFLNLKTSLPCQTALRRRIAARPSNAAPTNAKLPGSGTTFTMSIDN